MQFAHATKSGFKLRLFFCSPSSPWHALIALHVLRASVTMNGSSRMYAPDPREGRDRESFVRKASSGREPPADSHYSGKEEMLVLTLGPQGSTVNQSCIYQWDKKLRRSICEMYYRYPDRDFESPVMGFHSAETSRTSRRFCGWRHALTHCYFTVRSTLTLDVSQFLEFASISFKKYIFISPHASQQFLQITRTHTMNQSV